MRPSRLTPVLAALAAACADAAPPRSVALAPPEVAPGLGVYVARCEGCHGTDARGTRAGPDLLGAVADSTWAAAVSRSIREGVPPSEGSRLTVHGMPPVPMTPTDEQRLIAYLRWLAAGAPPATPDS